MQTVGAHFAVKKWYDYIFCIWVMINIIFRCLIANLIDAGYCRTRYTKKKKKRFL